MAKRCTPEEVELLLRDYDEDVDLDAFITTANIITDRLAAYDAANDSVLSATELKEIEKYLAGHFYRQADHGVQAGRERQGPACGDREPSPRDPHGLAPSRRAHGW